MKDRLFRGYGPLIGFTAMFLAIVLLVPSKAPEGSDSVESGGGQSVLDAIGSDGVDDEYIIDENGNLIDPETGEIIEADVAGIGEDSESSSGGSRGSSGSSGSGSGAKRTGGASGGGSNSGGNAAGANKGPTRVAGCSGPQVKGDPYSPPCIQFSGSNGGATHRGVSDSEIVVAVRIDGFDSGLVDAVTKSLNAAGKIPTETRDKVERTVLGLAEFFNKRYQFYGRKLKVVIYDGKGDPLTEIQGGGQEGARADAVKVSKEIGAFADISAVTAPYASALAQEGVINIGAPYVPRGWLTSRRPYSWTPLTDCSTVSEATSSYYATKMAGGTAKNAKGSLKDQPRRLAIIAPENAEYQACVDSGVQQLQQQGKAGDLKGRYKYTLSTNPGADVNSIMPKLTGDGITTLLCGCDPVFLNFLSTKFAKEGYFPEIIALGVALVDTDLVGQLMDQRVWENAFGVSFNGPSVPQTKTFAYQAYKSVRPDEPSIAVDLLYNQFLMLAIGVQMAGPNLTPPSFEKGMFDYPARSGPAGRWGFGPNDYSTSDDAREIFWNPQAASPFNGAAGAYQDPNKGARFAIGKWPGGQPRAFGR